MQAAEIDADLQTCLSRRHQIRLPYKFCTNPFSGSRYISHTNKKVTDSAKNRTLRSSLRAVKPKPQGARKTNLIQISTDQLSVERNRRSTFAFVYSTSPSLSPMNVAECQPDS